MRLVSVILLFPFFCAGQNLVPNGSFEGVETCPDDENQIPFATGWGSISTTDYFHSCATNPYFSTPYNWGRYQQPATGEAYSGVYTYIDSLPDVREIFYTHLTDSLSTGTKYYVSLKVSLSLSDTIVANCATNGLGVQFATDWPVSAINNTPDVYTSAVITDTMNWVTIFGSFIASGPHDVIGVGNYFDDANTDTMHMGADTTCNAYYFIDDICVSIDSAYCADFVGVQDEMVPALPSFSIFPNPTNGKFQVTGSELQVEEVRVFDLLGREVSSGVLNIDLSSYPSGIYFVKAGEYTRKFVLVR